MVLFFPSQHAAARWAGCEFYCRQAWYTICLFTMGSPFATPV